MCSYWFLTTSYICNIVASNKKRFWNISHRFFVSLLFKCTARFWYLHLHESWPFRAQPFGIQDPRLFHLVLFCYPLFSCSTMQCTKPHHAHFMPLEISAGFWWTLHVQNVTMSQFCEFAQRVCNTNMDGLYIFAHGRLNNVWTRLNHVVISISQAQIETEVHWNSCLSFAGRLEQDFCWPARLFLSYNFWSVFVTCRTQLEALCKQARRFTASTGIATLACLKPRQLQYLLRERKTPEEDIAKSETRKLQGMQKFFCDFSHLSMLFAFYQWLLQAISSFKRPCTRCQTVKTGVWQCQDGHLGCYTFFIQIIEMHENASSSLYRAWHFTIKFHAAWGYGGEGTRRETSHAEWPHSHCVIMSNQWTQTWHKQIKTNT